MLITWLGWLSRPEVLLINRSNAAGFLLERAGFLLSNAAWKLWVVYGGPYIVLKSYVPTSMKFLDLSGCWRVIWSSLLFPKEVEVYKSVSFFTSSSFSGRTVSSIDCYLLTLLSSWVYEATGTISGGVGLTLLTPSRLWVIESCEPLAFNGEVKLSLFIYMAP